MYGNELSIGRNWYTADSASLHTFQDGARWELHWTDGAKISCIEDTEAEARAALRRYGFNA